MKHHKHNTNTLPESLPQLVPSLSPESASAASFRKLLSSHLSIYNALTNPELDLQIPGSPNSSGRDRDRVSPPPPMDFNLGPLDPLVSILPWLPINNFPELVSAASPRPQSASILSITSDEDQVSDSMVVVPSVRSTEVMVFETDEEDDGDDYTYVGSGRHSKRSLGYDDSTTLTGGSDHAKRPVARPSNLHSLFVMPKMSLADSGKQAQLTILSSCGEALKAETQALMDYIRDNICVPRKIRVNHVVVAQSPLKFDLSVLKSSNLVFLVNDGSLLFVEFMNAMLRTFTPDLLPKLTVINIMTTNYFINLFEIINTTRPHQIWKTPSLRNSNLLVKVKAFIDEELDDGSNDKRTNAFRTKSKKFSMKRKKADQGGLKKQASSMYDSLTPTRKPDYRVIERQIRTEMLMSLSYANIDPLLLSSNLSHLRALLNAFSTFFGSSAPYSSPDENDDMTLVRRNIWLICSFSIGIGVGATVASGTISYLSGSIKELAKSLLPVKSDLSEASQQLLTAHTSAHTAPPELTEKLSEVMDAITKPIGKVSKAVIENLLTLSDNAAVNSVIEYLNLAFRELKSISTLAMKSILGGLRKSTDVLTGIVW